MPPLAGHGHRGIGIYAQELLRALKDRNDITVQQIAPVGSMESADVIHYPYFDPFFLTLPYHHSSPFIVTVHDLIPIVYPGEFPSGIRGWIKWHVQKHLLRKASLVITDSYASKRDIIQCTGVADAKIKVIYLGVDPSFFPDTSPETSKTIRKRFKLSKGFILYVGDVNYNKNIPGLLLAFETVAKTCDLDLVLVGKGFITPSPHKDLIDQQIQILHLQSRVRTVGYVSHEELRGLYSLATCYVHPSIAEGFGLPVLEAMACGCPVVCSGSTSLGEIAAGVSVGVDPNAAPDIARGIGETANNESLRLSLREKGIMHAKQFTWKKTAQETVEAYKSVVII